MNVVDQTISSQLRGADRLALAIHESKSQKGFALSDATLRYVAALYDPRACLESPWVPCQGQLTQKTRVFARGAFSTGTSGVGFVRAAICADYQTASIVNTTASSVMTAATLQSAATNTATAVTNSPFSQAQISTTPGSAQWRPVGAALYVRYAGTELNRGGDMLLMEEPNHGDVSAYSYNTALQLDGVKRIPVDNEWHHVCVVPNSAADVAFTANTNYYGAYPITVFISSATGGATPFEYEYYAWYEYVGSICRSPSASYNDIVGWDLVQGASNMYQQLDSEMGLDGLVRAIHAQMAQVSGHKVIGAPHGNWAGLLSFLPAIASLVGPALGAAARGAIGGLASHILGKTQQRKPPQKKQQSGPPRPPPRTVSLKKP